MCTGIRGEFLTGIQHSIQRFWTVVFWDNFWQTNQTLKLLDWIHAFGSDFWQQHKSGRWDLKSTPCPPPSSLRWIIFYGQVHHLSKDHSLISANIFYQHFSIACCSWILQKYWTVWHYLIYYFKYKLKHCRHICIFTKLYSSKSTLQIVVKYKQVKTLLLYHKAVNNICEHLAAFVYWH